MAEQSSDISHHNESDPHAGMDEPDSDFVINKNFKGFRKKFKGVNIETGNLDSPISSQLSDGDSEIWRTTSEKEFSVAPKLTTNSEVIWNSSGWCLQ